MPTRMKARTRHPSIRKLLIAGGFMGLLLGQAAAVIADEVPPTTAGIVVAEPPTQLPTALLDRKFDVWIDDREVGAHSYRFTGEPEDFRVVSQASFAMKIAFITVFSYEHKATEQWRDGCLVALDSATETGDDFKVAGEARPEGFSLETLGGGQTYDLGCAWGFAYWNPGMRDRPTLINAQDGNLFEVEIKKIAPRPLSIGSGSVSAQAWALTGEALDITLFYDDQDHWIGLDTVVAGGRILRYRPAPDDPFYPG